MATGHPRPWTDTETQALRDGHAAGKTLTALAKELGRPKSSTHDKAAELGLNWDRTKTEQATRNRKAVCADLRAQALERAYTRVHHLYDRLEAEEFRTVMRGEYGTEHTAELDFVPPNDEKTLAQAIGAHMATAKRIEDAESETSDVGRSVLGDLMTGLRSRYAEAVNSRPDQVE